MILYDRKRRVMCGSVKGRGERVIREPDMNAQILPRTLTRQNQLERVEVIQAISPILDHQRVKVRLVQAASLQR